MLCWPNSFAPIYPKSGTQLNGPTTESGLDVFEGGRGKEAIEGRNAKRGSSRSENFHFWSFQPFFTK